MITQPFPALVAREQDVVKTANHLFTLEFGQTDNHWMLDILKVCTFTYDLYFDNLEICIPHLYINIGSKVDEYTYPFIRVFKFGDSIRIEIDHRSEEYYSALEDIHCAMINKIKNTNFDVLLHNHIEPLIDMVVRYADNYIIGVNTLLDIPSTVTLNGEPVLYHSCIEVDSNNGVPWDRLVVSFLATKEFIEEFDEQIIVMMMDS